MGFNVISIESILNEKIYTKKNFVQELLSEAVELNIITEEECNFLENKILQGIKAKTLEAVINFAYGFEELSDVLAHNYMYLISRYLYSSMTPVEALEYLKNVSGETIVKKSVKSFEIEVSAKYFEIEKYVKNNLTEKNTSKYKVYFKEILSNIRRILAFEQKVDDIVELTDEPLVPLYITLNYHSDIINQNIVEDLMIYADSLMLECDIRKKIGFNVGDKISTMNVKENNIKYFIKQHKIEADNKRAIQEVNDKIKELNVQRRYNNEPEINEDEKQFMIEEALMQVSEKYSELNYADFEFINSLADIFVEFVCVILQVKGTIIPRINDEKRTLVRNLGKDAILDIIFSHEELFDFTDIEKEYLTKHLVSNI